MKATHILYRVFVVWVTMICAQSAFSQLRVLADQVGMSKSGLFAHFRSKEDVQIDLLSHMAEFATAHVVEPSMKAGEGLPRLRALVRNWFGWAQRAGLPGGCPVAAGLFEFDDVEGRVRNKILEMEGLHIKLLDPRKLPSILPAVCEKQ